MTKFTIDPNKELLVSDTKYLKEVHSYNASNQLLKAAYWVHNELRSTDEDSGEHRFDPETSELVEAVSRKGRSPYKGQNKYRWEVQVTNSDMRKNMLQDHEGRKLLLSGEHELDIASLKQQVVDERGLKELEVFSESADGAINQRIANTLKWVRFGDNVKSLMGVDKRDLHQIVQDQGAKIKEKFNLA